MGVKKLYHMYITTTIWNKVATLVEDKNTIFIYHEKSSVHSPPSHRHILSFSPVHPSHQHIEIKLHTETTHIINLKRLQKLYVLLLNSPMCYWVLWLPPDQPSASGTPRCICKHTHNSGVGIMKLWSGKSGRVSLSVTCFRNASFKDANEQS